MKRSPAYRKLVPALFATFFCLCHGFAQPPCRIVEPLKNGWLFLKSDSFDGSRPNLDDRKWQKVTIPHDWAIEGPFNRNNDLQKVRIIENGETRMSEQTGRTGSLPYEGTGWYRKHLPLSATLKGRRVFIEFDGAMSHATVFLNGIKVGVWPYGYASFGFDLTPFVHWGKDNVLAVRLHNDWQSSRWYPGAGINREVRLVITRPLHVAHWGTFVRTLSASAKRAHLRMSTVLEGPQIPAGNIRVLTDIYDDRHRLVAGAETVASVPLKPVVQDILVAEPQLWSADSPRLYYAVTTVHDGKRVTDRYSTAFGIRQITFTADSGMLVNGKRTRLKGVCLHDGLGPLGTAYNQAAWRYRLQLLKNMGCNAIRGSHNPHDPQLLDLCDQMGFYYIDEAFDEWKIPKVENGYHLLFDKWAAQDLDAMIRRDRNHPSVIMYSIGNEVREQASPTGWQTARYLTALCHRADDSRPVTAAFNDWDNAIKNGLAAAVDIPGWNYKPSRYALIHKEHPDWIIYGSESASTVSSRGAYELPAVTAIMKTRPDHQCSSYDLEYCQWSQLPEMEWKSEDGNSFVAGEFVWTGFDYLGEPTPYESEWPSRSSYFGIIDFCGIPKDRYYLYKSRWSVQKVLHVLPHWNWPGMAGRIVPVYVYTNYPSAEVFINGKSFGKRSFDSTNLLDTYRLRWYNTVYSPGTLKVVAYDRQGRLAEVKEVHTALRPASIRLVADRNRIKANGEDVAMVVASIRDKNGVLCPLANNLMHFRVSGAGRLKALGNGDPTSLVPFQSPERKAFNGKCMAIVESDTASGWITIKAESPHLASCIIHIKSTSNDEQKKHSDGPAGRAPVRMPAGATKGPHPGPSQHHRVPRG